MLDFINTEPYYYVNISTKAKMKYKFEVNQKVYIEDAMTHGIVRVRRHDEDTDTNFYFVEYFSSLLKSMTTQFFRESKLQEKK